MPDDICGGRQMKKVKDSNPDSAGAKLKRRASNLATTLTAILGFYGATTSAGYFLGRARSPDWSNSITLTNFVYSRHSCKVIAPESQTSPAVVELTIRAGDAQYVYRSDKEEVRCDFLSPGELAVVRTPTLSSDAYGAALLTAGTTTVSAATALAKASGWLARIKWKQGRIIAVGVAIVGGGAAFGYFIGYKGKPDYGSAAFHSALMNADRWSAAAKQYLPPAGDLRCTGRTSPQ
jgi:hypothetical protein